MALTCQVKVINDNTYDFKQDFKGVEVKIPAGKHVEMEYSEAVEFLAKFYPMKVDSTGRQLPESYKMLRMDPTVPPYDDNPVQQAAGDEYMCHSCGYKGLSQWDLEGHIRNLHADTVIQQQPTKNKKGGLPNI